MVGLLYKPTCNLQTNHFLSLFKIDHIIFCGTAWQVFGTLGLMLCCSPAKKNFNFTIPHLFAQCPGLQFFSHDHLPAMKIAMTEQIIIIFPHCPGCRNWGVGAILQAHQRKASWYWRDSSTDPWVVTWSRTKEESSVVQPGSVIWGNIWYPCPLTPLRNMWWI